MEELIDGWFRYFWILFWQSSLLIGIVLLLYFATFKCSPALRYGILSLALIKLLLPPTFGFSTGFINHIPNAKPGIDKVTVSLLDIMPQTVATPVGTQEGTVTALEPYLAGEQGKSVGNGIPLKSLLFSIWSAIVLTMMSLHSWRNHPKMIYLHVMKKLCKELL